MELRTGRHVVFMLHAHLVFTTKRRGKVLTQEHLQRLQEIFRDVCAEFEVELREFNGESDHVHLLVNYPPKVRLSELVNSLKGVSSRRLKQEFPAIKAFWSVRKSRCARDCGAPADHVCEAANAEWIGPDLAPMWNIGYKKYGRRAAGRRRRKELFRPQRCLCFYRREVLRHGIT